MKRIFLLSIVALTCLVTQLNATSYTFVGSWQVDQGPYWVTEPPAYTGQQAAALLFGGTPDMYAISTVGPDPSTINFMDWVSTWGGACNAFPCGTLSAENFVVTEDGFYVNPGDTSSYVLDWAEGSQYTNYAFVAANPIPEPASLLLVGSGIAVLAKAVRRKRARAA